MVNNPKSSAKDLAKVLTDDQVLTARLLKLVNSSFYGFPQRISTVTGAIVLLGFDAIRNLLLTTSVFDLFSRKSKASKFKRERVWDHSLGCAVGAKVIGHYITYEKIEELFVSGLLHDIGKIVEMQFLPEAFDEAVFWAANNNALIGEAESQVLGYTHAEVGKALAEAWNLPQKLVHVIAYHHSFELAGKHSLEAAVVHLADILCRSLEFGSGGDEKIPALDRQAWTMVGLDKGDIEPIMEEIEVQYEDISKFTGQGY